MNRLNETHDPALSSWIESANAPGCDFPIQNLPFGVFCRRGTTEPPRGGVAIGDQILDLAAAAQTGVFSDTALIALQAASAPALNALMALGASAWSALRLALSRALRANSAAQTSLAACLVAQTDAELLLPALIGDYTDFYASIHHATRVGRLLRPDQPLLPNYKWIPTGYHGRSSSIGVSPQDFPRPHGQTLPSGLTTPLFGPSKRLDYELELGAFIGPGNALGSALTMAQAEAQIFGLCLLNDWSARDIQGWEYQPLGPFLGKSFATTISPWIVTLEALAPYRLPFTRPADDPAPLSYLSSADNAAHGAIDIQLEAALQTAAMRERGERAATVSHSSFRHSYWTLAQLVTHHSINGCNLRPGDLLGSGTQSGPTPAESGSLLELSEAGRKALRIGSGSEERRFLEDGDRVVLRAWCEQAGGPRIGFGAAVGTVLPARNAA
ncbi:fumarylacetoacetase [Panacagrimonas sp.]|uniref:fumarylacetoacetase n=1 Tax=Panacagrimonas sp. TaxID=2480088 RepID=UPI003B51F5CC